MKNYAEIKKDLVVNVIVADANFAEAMGYVEIPDYVGVGWKLETGNWISPTPYTPSEADITAAVSQARSLAYQKESDPLFFKAQRGEATMEEWLAKVEEIKTRYPDK